MRSTLIPQFIDYNCTSGNVSIVRKKNDGLCTFKKYYFYLQTQKREFLLSIALEYNCINLLRECARAWADGSHQGRISSDALSLSTLTDWIWQRATLIKNHCNQLCVSLFDYSGCRLALREQNVLLNCSRQLKTLSELLSKILTTCRTFIPTEGRYHNYYSSIYKDSFLLFVTFFCIYYNNFVDFCFFKSSIIVLIN